MSPDSIIKRVNWAKHASNMADAILPHDIELLRISWGEAQKQFPAIGSFNLKNENVRKAITRLSGQRMKDIADTTKADLTRLLEGIYDRDKIPGTDEIRREIQKAGIETSKYRAERIARSELAIATNAGTTASYREAGIEKVTVLDGDDDEDCSSVDGTVQTIEWAEENPIAHPNCVRAFSAYLED
jgi:hypothetical protein